MIDQQTPSPTWDPIKIFQLSNPDVQGWTCKGMTQTGRRCRRFLGQANRDAIDTILPKITPNPPSLSSDKPSSTTKTNPEETRRLNALARCCLCHVHDDDDIAKVIALEWSEDLDKARSAYAEKPTPSPKPWKFTFSPGPVSPVGGLPSASSALQSPAPSPAPAPTSFGNSFPSLKPPAERTIRTPVSVLGSAARGRSSLSPGAASASPPQQQQSRRRTPTPGPTPQDRARAGVGIKQEKDEEVFRSPQSVFASQPKIPSPTSFSFTPTPPKSAFTFQSPPLAQTQFTSQTSTPSRSSFGVDASNIGAGLKTPGVRTTSVGSKPPAPSTPPFSVRSLGVRATAGPGVALQLPAPRTSTSTSFSPQIKQENQDQARRESRNHFYYDPDEADANDNDTDDLNDQERSTILSQLREQEDTLRRCSRQHSELIERLEGMRF
ncbi:hypothetical protein V8F20_004675 [Naviculisporaceae sp. PSN 640]